MFLKYLTKFSDEALNNIVRHLSSRPNAISWKSGVNIRDILSLYALETPLSAVVSQSFNALEPHCAEENELCFRTSEDILCYRTAEDIQSIVREAAHIFLSIRVESKKFTQQFLDLFKARCTHVKMLTVSQVREDFDLEQVLRVVSGQLEILGIETFTCGAKQVNAIANHCTGLSALIFDDGKFTCDSSAVWMTVGPSLTDLTLFPDDDDDLEDSDEWVILLRHIKEFCSCLQKFRIRLMLGYQEMDLVTEICTGRGPNLLLLSMFACDVRPWDGIELRRACPNMSLEAEIDDTRGAFLTEIGPQVTELNFSNAMKNNTTFRNALLSCDNLSSGIVPYCENSVDFLEALFVNPKKRLTHVAVEFFRNDDWTLHFERILGILSRHTTGLKNVNFQCECLPPDAFCDLAFANPDIESVHIGLVESTNHADDGDVGNEFTKEESLAGIVKAFTCCPNLRKLCVSDLGMYAEVEGEPGRYVRSKSRGVDGQMFSLVDAACCALRHRRVFVYICGRVYLQ